MNILEIPAFVINLPRSVDRLDLVKRNIADAGFTDVTIFEALDGRDKKATADTLIMFGIPNIDQEVSTGQLGCMLSHFKVLKHVIDNNIPHATIFEDDVHFHPEWSKLHTQYLEKTPTDFDILFIGNGLDSCRTIHSTHDINEITIEPAWCTHAYVVTLEGAKKVLTSLLKWNYKEFNHGSRGKTLTGLYPIDIMIVNIENKCVYENQPKPFIWYSWNGTKYPCAFNKLPTTGNGCRNTGLVFQNTDMFKTLVGEDGYTHTDNFYDENGNIVDTSSYETTEQWIADNFISPNAVVLELGGRLGVVATHVNKRLNNTRNHFVVEPDPIVFNRMFRNLVSHNCNPHVFNGVISNKPLYFQQAGIGSRTRELPCSCESFIVPNKSLKQVIQETGLKFDTLVADCEGCLEGFFNENIDYLDTFKMITYEEDYGHECDYEKIKRILADHHFVCIRPGGHSVWERRPPAPTPVPGPATPWVFSDVIKMPDISSTRKKFFWNKR